MLDLERSTGRERGRRFGPRVLDLDLLLYGNLVEESSGLVVPHPRMRERAFVIVPLAEIAADWVVPATGVAPDEPVGSILARLDTTGVEPRDDLSLGP
jgi:2-amino-4-hydroxy-6-hydroxymethyldihydropteridine diphosphokinase